jgi:hypothetical protein
MSLPVDPSLLPVLRSVRRLRRVLEQGSQSHVPFYCDQLTRELGNVHGPSEHLLIARNQLLRVAHRDVDLRLLDTVQELVFGGRIQSDDTIEPASRHPLEGAIQRALEQLGPFLTPELCRSQTRIHDFLQSQASLLIALWLLQDVLVLPPSSLSELTRSAVPEVREWAQAVIDAA